MKSGIRAEGKITIKLVDRNTGIIVSEKTLRNDININFAEDLASILAGMSGYDIGQLDKVELYDSSSALIKELSPPTTLERLAGADHYDAHSVFEDDSTDEYTVAEAYLHYKWDSTYRCIAFKRGLNVSKAADQKLVVDWTISVYFSS